MKKILKRWGTLLLAAVMTLSLLPTAAFAADDAPSGAIAADDASRDIPVGNYTLDVDSSITDGSSGPKEKATDGDEETWWHSNSTPPAGGHWIAVELSEAKWISALRYKPRSDYTSANPSATVTHNGNGYVTSYAVYVSQNGTDWTSVAQGDWNAFDSNNIPTGAWQVANFTPVRAKFIKLVGVRCAGNGNANNPHMHAAEIRVVAAPEQPAQAYSVSGTVVDADGNSLSGAAVTIAGQRTTTDTEGAYTITNLLPGDYTATVALAGYELVGGAQVTVDSGDVTGHTFRMQAVNRAITGTVMSGGSGLEGAAVTLVQADSPYTTVTGPSALTGADGSYTLGVNSVPAGSYRVRVAKDGYGAVLSNPVAVTTASPQGTFAAGAVSISAIDLTDVTYHYDMSNDSDTPEYTAGNNTSVQEQNHVLSMEFNGNSRANNQVRLNGINFQDAVVEFDATRGGTGNGNGFGVALRWTDNNNYIFVGRNSTGGWYSESMNNGTSSQSTAVTTGPSFNSGETRHFKIQIRQDGDTAKVSLWIDGLPVIDDAQAGNGQGPAAPGQLAFVCGSNNTSATVRNLYISVKDAAYTITMPDTLAGYVVISGAQDKALAEGGGTPESGMKRYTAHAGDVVNIYSANPAQNEMSAPLTVYRTEDSSVSSTENILRVPTAASAHSERGSCIQFRMPAYDVTLEPTLTPVQTGGDEVTSVLILRSGDPDIPETIGVGSTAALKAVIVPGLETGLTWTSSDTSVVSVEGQTESNPDENGKIATATAAITGVSAGTATITVTTADGETDTREVTVGTPVSNVIFQDTSTLTLYTNGQPDTATLTATIDPSNATNRALKWVSSDETVAAVDQNGRVTAVAPGTARITAISQQNTGASAYRDVRVVTRPKRLTLDMEHLDMTVDVGDSAHERVVKATLMPEDTSDKTINWSTSDATIATVTKPAQWQELGIQDAIVTGVKPGTATITARSVADNTITATMTVRVTQKLTGQVSISGPLKFGSVLTANDNSFDTAVRGDLTYTWYRGEDASGTVLGTGKTYTPVKEDIGSKLTVKVSCRPDSYYMGESTFTTAAVITKEDGHEVLEELLSHVNCSAADANDGQITGLRAAHVYQYQKQGDDGEWPADEASWKDVPANSTEITGLAPGSYRIRHAGDDTRFAGVPSNTITIVVTGGTEVALTIPARFTGGIVRANRSQIPVRDTVTLTVTPDEGYELASLEAVYTDGNGEEQTLTPTKQSDGKYTFTMPAFPVTIAAVFRLKTYTIGHDLTNISCSLGAEANHTAAYGEAFTITLTPADGFTMPRTLTLTETDTGKTFNDYTYEADPTDPAKRVLTFANGVTCSITISGEGVPLTYAVSYAPERVRFVTAPRQVGWHEELIVTMTPEVGYHLPETITITMGGAALAADVDYSYNSTSGVVTIHEGVITGVLEIGVRGEPAVTPLDKVSISGIAQVGQRLTVNVTPAEADGHVAYQWYWIEGEGDDAVETLIDYATGRTLVLSEASLGKALVVKADALPGSGFSGTVNSQPTGIVISAGETEVMPEWVEIQRDRINLDVGGTDTIVAYVGPSNATNKTVLWSSSDETVVRVENGVITAVSPGVAVITVTAQADSRVTDTCRVTVAETRNVAAEAEDVSVTYDGKAHSIAVTVTNPAAGNAAITYSSDGINYRGTNPTFSAAGEHTVWYQVTSAGMVSFQSQAKVIILKAAPEISVSADRAILTQAGNVIITITAPDYADPDGISLEVNDLMIPVTRNEDGTYTAKLPAAEKTYTFTVTLRPTDNYNGASASYSVTVKKNSPSFTGTGTGSTATIQPTTTTETRVNPDGSVTTIETDDATGVVTETTRRSDGTKLEKVATPDGDVTVTVTDARGEVLAKVEIPAELPAPKTRFVDVPKGHWADEAIHNMAALEVVNGVGGNRFDMGSSMTRAALATVLSRMSNGQKGLDISFDDVASGQWYADGIAWAAKNGIVTGYSASSFGPNDPITREQLAVMLCRYARLLGMDTSADSRVLDSFTDGGLTHDWAAESMAWCVTNGILKGKGNATLASTATATRAEVAVMLQRFIDLIK